MGSGKFLMRAIHKHGQHNFNREILQICETEQEAYDLESKLVDQAFIERKDTYNVTLGGTGYQAGEHHPFYGRKMTDEERQAHSERLKGREVSAETREKIGAAQTGEKHWNYGGSLSDETRAKISAGNKGKVKTPEHIEKIMSQVRGRKSSEARRQQCIKNLEKAYSKTRGVSVHRDQAERAAEAKRAKNPLYSPDNVELLWQLREEGLSHKKIAEVLNERAVPSYKDKGHTKNSIEGVFKYLKREEHVGSY